MAVLIHDKTFVPFIPEEQIKARVSELAQQINEEYAGKYPLIIGVLNGSFIFASDLFRCLTIEAEISFIKLASYHGTSSTGNVVTAIGLEENLQARHIIIVEDIIDTGRTLSHFMPEIYERQPASVKIAALLVKPEKLEYEVRADYVVFEIPEKFVVGYGLDYDGLGRNLRDLHVLGD